MIKKYSQFIKSLYIKESIKEYEVKSGDYWKLSKDEINDFFIDFSDKEYHITLERGFFLNRNNYEESFTNKIYLGDLVKASYWITIESVNNFDAEDIEYLKESIDRIKYYSDGKFIGAFEYDWLDHHQNDNKVNLENLPEYGTIHLLFCQNKEIEILEKEILEYYNIKSEDGLYLDVSISDMVDILISDSGNFNWRNLIVDCNKENCPVNNFWDFYNTDYYIEYLTLDTLIYYISKENLPLFIKSVINEVGLIECLNLVDDKNINTMDELVDFIINERFYRTLDKLSKDTEVLERSISLLAEYQSSSHAEENYKEMISEFSKIVSKEFTINSEYRKKSNGVEMKYYNIEFQNEWIDELDYEEIYSKDLYDIFSNYCSENISFHDFDPNFSDYSTINKSDFNRDLKEIVS